ncbi:MAG: flagellar hook-length control protein FliK [bacterium]
MKDDQTVFLSAANPQARKTIPSHDPGSVKLDDKRKNFIPGIDVMAEDGPSDQCSNESMEKIAIPVVKKTTASASLHREAANREPDTQLQRIPESQTESAPPSSGATLDTVVETLPPASRPATTPATPVHPEIVQAQCHQPMHPDAAPPVMNETHAAQTPSASGMAQAYTEKIAQLQETASRQIVRAVQGSLGSQRSQVSLRLVPESLGHIVVRMTLENNLLSAQISAEKHATRALLEQNITALRSAFDDQGIRVERLTISKETLDAKQQDSAKNDSQSNRSSRHDPAGEDDRSGRRSSGERHSRRNNSYWKDRFTAMDYFQ